MKFTCNSSGCKVEGTGIALTVGFSMKFFAAVTTFSIYTAIIAPIWSSSVHALTTSQELCSDVKSESPPLITVQSITSCLKNTHSDVDRSELLKLRAKEYLQLSRFNHALEDFNSALELQPNDAEIYNGMGIVYKRLGEYKLAMKNYAIAQELSAQQPTPYVVLQPQPIFEPPSPTTIKVSRIKALPSKMVFFPPPKMTEALNE